MVDWIKFVPEEQQLIPLSQENIDDIMKKIAKMIGNTAVSWMSRSPQEVEKNSEETMAMREDIESLLSSIGIPAQPKITEEVIEEIIPFVDMRDSFEDGQRLWAKKLAKHLGLLSE